MYIPICHLLYKSADISADFSARKNDTFSYKTKGEKRFRLKEKTEIYRKETWENRKERLKRYGA